MLRLLPETKPCIALVEDNAFIRQVWEMMLGPEVLVTFESPEEFFARASAESDFVAGLEGVVTDYYFDGCSDLNGDDFAKELCKVWSKPVLLCSDLPSGSIDSDVFVGQVGKEPPSIENLRNLLRLPSRKTTTC